MRFGNNDVEVVSLRRGTCTLHGSGTIGLGASPADAAVPCVKFEVMRFSDTQPQLPKDLSPPDGPDQDALR